MTASDRGQYKLDTFRHFFASYCAQQNMSYRHVLEWMGALIRRNTGYVLHDE